MFDRMLKDSPLKAAALGLTVALGVAMTAGGEAKANDISAWQKNVVSTIATKQVYPRAAMSQELEGRARVQVTIDRNGNITGYDIVESTGHELLDAEVVRLKDRINPLPKPPAGLSDASLSFVLPLSWVLQ